MTDEIRPINIGIDKLRFGTNNVGPKTLRHMLGICKDLVKGKTARTLSNVGQVHKHRYSVSIGEHGTLYLAFRPNRKDAGHPLVACELNPNKLGPEGLVEARAVLIEIIGTRYETAMAAAFVTLIDYFADYPVKMQELFIEMTRKEVCGSWGFQFDGTYTLQTVYLGAGGSDGQVRAYDKDAEERAKASKPYDWDRIDPVFDAQGNAIGCRMRIESRRLINSVPLSRIHGLENPFARIRIAMIPEAAKEFQNPLGRALLDSARALGWQLAVKRLKEPNEERRYRRAFAKHLCDWWNPDQAAVDVGVALLRTGLFPASAFDPRVQRRERQTPKTVVPTFDRQALTGLRKAESSLPKVSPWGGFEPDEEDQGDAE